MKEIASLLANYITNALPEEGLQEKNDVQNSNTNSRTSSSRRKVDQFFDNATKKKKTTLREYNPFLNREGDIANPYIDYQQMLDSQNISKVAKEYITKATGLQPSLENRLASMGVASGNSAESTTGGTNLDGFSFNNNADVNKLSMMDVTTELPKLSPNQIAKIIEKHFSKSTVIKPSDASGIYDAQQKTGMSALAILGIGALESGYGTSAIAKQKNNLWGWNATNVNPGGNATTFAPIAQGAYDFATKYLKTYYNNYGAKSIYAAGTGNNPKGMGYAYFDNGTINSQWATSINTIMGNFYRTAQDVYKTEGAKGVNGKISGNAFTQAADSFLGTPYVWGGESMSEGGMDCSGFIYAALNKAGYNVPRLTAQGYRKYGTVVKKSELQPGDLVFFGSPGNATHIGMYYGNGKIIHSTGGSKNTRYNPGKGVSYKDLSAFGNYIEGRRL